MLIIIRKRRVEDVGLRDGIDYVITDKFDRNSAGRPSKEYTLSLDSAKHVALVEGNEQGKKIRQYFIDVEKAARKAMTKYDPNPL